MRISSGLSVIQTLKPHEGGHRPVKVYTWPDYNAGRVEKTRGVFRHKGSNAVYYKPSPEEQDDILARVAEQKYGEYTRGGNMRFNTRPVGRGSLFEALV